MNPSTKRVLLFVISGILLLSACAPAPAATPDPAEIQRQIQEAVALTVAAQNAEAEQAQALVAEATNTPLPTQTEAVPPTAVPLIPTATPFVLVPPTVPPAPSGGGSGYVTVKPEYACDIIRQRPYDDTAFKPNDTFDIKWTIVNIGTKTWPAGLDLVYHDGPEMTDPGAGPIELPAMKPGDQFSVVLDATVPNKEGRQVMVWKLEGGFCYPYVRIIVEK